ncbi:hypothetical protein FACS189429_8610 [Bacteroidia bacterium]|nr:hypothetical protein FACS189429_8610 [Bacteroidia bacterium]
MKKAFIVLTVLLAVNQIITAQILDSFIADFAKSEGVETQNIDSQMLKMAADSVDFGDSDTSDIVQNLKAIEVMTAKTPNAALRNKSTDFINSFTEDADYATLVKAGEGNKKVLIVSGVTKKSLIILAVDDEIAIVKINGDFDLTDLSQIMNGVNM